VKIKVLLLKKQQQLSSSFLRRKESYINQEHSFASSLMFLRTKILSLNPVLKRAKRLWILVYIS